MTAARRALQRVDVLLRCDLAGFVTAAILLALSDECPDRAAEWVDTLVDVEMGSSSSCPPRVLASGSFPATCWCSRGWGAGPAFCWPERHRVGADPAIVAMTIAGSVVSTTMHSSSLTGATSRLRPLLTATWLQAVILWVPVEKLFIDEIGFDAGSVALMAAAYAAVVPFLEIPSGILADRWSRQGVLVIGHLALAASALVGGLATSVLTYVAAALLLGVFFAMHSGTVDALVYDTLVEETGSSDGFERVMGRLRAWESSALVVSALAGGALAALMSPRATYFLTVPFGIASVWCLLSLDEPRLHKAGERLLLRAQIATTYRVLLTDRALRSVIATMVLAALLLQALLEFGPLWMVALAAPAFLYGPHWAGLMGALGLGGILAGRASFTATAPLTATAAVLIGASTILAVSHQPVVVAAAQVGIATVLVAVSAFLSRLLHDEISSSLRAGVASGVGTLTWVVFLPFALAFGTVADQWGVHAAASQLIAIAVLLSASLARLAFKQRTIPAAPVVAMAVPPTQVEPCV